MDRLGEIEAMVSWQEDNAIKWTIPIDTADMRYLLDAIHGHEEAEESLQKEIKRLDGEVRLLRQDLVLVERVRDDGWDAANAAREMASADSIKAVSVVAGPREENKRLLDAIKDWAEHARWEPYYAQPHIKNLLDIAKENCDER